jgi:hypothetical protein
MDDRTASPAAIAAAKAKLNNMKGNVQAEGGLKVKLSRKPGPGRGPDDPLVVFMGFEGHLKMGTAAKPYATGLGETKKAVVKAPKWAPWTCKSAPEKGASWSRD